MKKKTNITTTSKDLAGELRKSNLWFTALYTLVICLLSGMLVFSYFSVFTSSFYLKGFNGNYLIGVVDTSLYESTESGQILKVQKYTNINSLKVGDEVFYSDNSGDGSGVVQKLFVVDGYITISTNGQQKNIATSTVIGKITQKTGFWGYILWFFQSWTGVITLNILLVLIVVLRLILGLTWESTSKGRQLKSKLKKQNQSYKNIKRMQRLYRLSGLDVDSLNLLSGSYNQNKQSIIEFSKTSDISSTYKYLLSKVHRAYVTQPKLTISEREKITNCLELMCLVDYFDEDVEYMLTDLILHSSLVDFDTKNFAISLKEYLNKNHSTEDLLCLMQVMYVLIKTNDNLQNAEIGSVIVDFILSLPTKTADKEIKELINLTNSIKNLIKF